MNASDSSGGEALRIYGNLSLLEMAPVLLAAEQFYVGKTSLAHGSVMALWGEASDLASLTSAGHADLALNSETQALRGSHAHPDLRFIFTVAECPYRIVARRSAGIARVADLRGKRVGTQLESSAEFFLDAMLQSSGVAPQEVARIPFMAHTRAPISALPQTLCDGEIDAVALWEPQVERAKAALGARWRAITSVPPPAAKGTTMRTGFDGYGCADESVAAKQAQAVAAKVQERTIFVTMMRQRFFC